MKINMYKSQAAMSIEYFNAGNGHYFRTANPSEIELLDEGVYIKGWNRTGNDFLVVKPGASVAWTMPVARFWSQKLDSHFFTADPAEVAAVGAKFGDTWQLETTEAFRVFSQDMGDESTDAVTRYWNKADNHRYVGAHFPVDAAFTEKWVEEGHVFYVPKEAALSDDGTSVDPGPADPPGQGEPAYSHPLPEESVILQFTLGQNYRDVAYTEKVNVFPFVVPTDHPSGLLQFSASEFQSPPTVRQSCISEVPGDFNGTQGKVWHGGEGTTTIATVEIGKDIEVGRTYYFNIRAWSRDIGSTGQYPEQNVSVSGDFR